VSPPASSTPPDQSPANPPKAGERLEQLLSRIGAQVGAPVWRRQSARVSGTLQILCELAGARLAEVFELSGDGDQVSRTHEWLSPGQPPGSPLGPGAAAAALPCILDCLRAGEALRIGDPVALRDCDLEACANLEELGVRSLLVLPLLRQRALHGLAVLYLRDDFQPSTERDTATLRLMTDALALALDCGHLGDQLRVAASVFRHAHDGIFMTDADHRILDVNPSFSEITGFPREEAVGQSPRILSSGLQDREFYANLWNAVSEAGIWHGEIWNRRRNGALYLERLTVLAVQDASGDVEHYVGIFSDVTSLREQENRLELLAYYDALTQLPNRVLLADRLEQALAYVRRSGQHLAVCLLDLDRFKPINEEYGRDTGDRMLVEFARRLERMLPAGDTVARLGGDEFAILLSDLKSTDECDLLTRRIQAVIASPFEVSPGTTISVTASIGVRVVPPDDADPDTLLRQAYQMLYAVKRDARGNVLRFNPEHERQLSRRRDMITAVGHALRAGQMELHYQPVVDLHTGETLFAEALVRWRDPVAGLLAPGQWLPLIEEDSVMLELGAWVLARALADCARWNRDGLAVGVSVNVSARELQDPAFAERVRAALADCPDLAPAFLKLEVLESAALVDLTAVTETMAACARFGVEFSLDDFGTGYSSLTYLRTLPATALKIDRSFVSHMIEDAGAMAIVRGVIGLAAGSGRLVIAEGVEKASQAVRLREMDCDMGQGYGFAPPLPADRFIAWVRSRAA
jgi:diguanylate cyclase (GGDEF)-like protein/PAS domain S-box-containing protein